MKLLRTIFLLLISINLFANSEYIDSIDLAKVKKLVQKEEEIALAYKNYLLKKGTNPTSISDLISQGFLSSGYSVISPFGKEIKLSTQTNYDSTDSIPDSVKVKTNVFDYYYSNKYRVNTKAPVSVKNGKVEIVLSYKEKFIYDNKANITTVKTDARNKYYLDTSGVLHWYDGSNNYKFSIDKELILDSSVKIIDDVGKTTTEFINLFNGKNVLFAGLTILQKALDGSSAAEYIHLGETVGIVKVKSEERDIGSTIIQFTRRAGGMIVNGDIYTWGNNGNKITGINETYSGATASDRYPVITGMVRVKVRPEDNESRNINYFSSPLRPKFVDFFATVFHSTCGITTKGELFCGGKTGLNNYFGTIYTKVDNSSGEEMLYKSTFFNGSSTAPKAKKIFANNTLWTILSQTGDIYSWGYEIDQPSGFSGNGSSTFNDGCGYQKVCNWWTCWDEYKCVGKNENIEPQLMTVNEGTTKVLFSDITYSLSLGHRKIVGLSNDGYVYMWGMETYNSNYDGNCNVTWESRAMNLCAPLKLIPENSNSSNKTFESIQGGLDAFVGKDKDGKYFKISQPKGKKIQVISIDDAIKTYSSYSATNDAEILSVDFSRKVSELTTKSTPSSGIVWVNSKNELKGDYFTADNQNDNIFKSAINKIKWKKIKVIDDDNGMCGIDINNQMYCWGIMSFYRNGALYNDMIGNTYMIPVFNTNLYDSDKDFLVAEGGYNGHLTNMTSGTWSTTNSAGKTGAFFMKYPTYIGGFNYEFIFK